VSTDDQSNLTKKSNWKNLLSIGSTRTRQMVISTAIMSLVLISIAEVFIIIRNVQVMLEKEETNYNSYLLADELRQSSDDLTRMVRMYSQTGNTRYADYYYQILEIRNGKAPRPERYHTIYWDFIASTGVPPRPAGDPISLNELIQEAEFTENELNLLKEAENESKSLVNLEVQAINAMVGFYKDSSGNYTVTGRPNPGFARRLLYSKKYLKARERAMSPLEKFFEAIEKRTSEEVQYHKNLEETMVFILIGTISLAALLSITSIILMASSSRKL